MKVILSYFPFLSENELLVIVCNHILFMLPSRIPFVCLIIPCLFFLAGFIVKCANVQCLSGSASLSILSSQYVPLFEQQAQTLSGLCPTYGDLCCAFG